MKRLYSLMMAMLVAGIAMAQDNGLNPIVQLKIQELEYKRVEVKEQTADKVLNIITDVVVGTTKDTQHENMVPAVNAMIPSVFNYVRRVNSVEEFQDGDMQYMLTGTITNLSTTSKREDYETKDSQGKVIKKSRFNYDSHVSVALTLTNLANKHTSTKSFSVRGSSTGDLSSPEKAISAAINSMKWSIVRYYNYYFPIRANIIKLSEIKKDKVKELYLDAGAAIAVNEDMHFTVFAIDEIAGRETQKKIGRVKVKEVSGEDICLCKVQKGTKEIKEAVDAHVTLIAISED